MVKKYKGLPGEEKTAEQGFYILEDVYSNREVQHIIEKIEQVDPSGPSFRKTNDVFAIRRVLQEIPGVASLIFTDKLRDVISSFGMGYFAVKSIYFDKPGGSNWFVAYHQDLTISVDRRGEYPGFNAWTVKQDHIAVQPPVDILENIYTVRIHLDDTDEANGALKVVPGSHKNGVVRPELADRSKETVCRVKKGGVMIMKPLLLHASARTVDTRRRRVVHIEFSSRRLPEGLEWGERRRCTV